MIGSVVLFSRIAAAAPEWQEVKGTHFVVYYFGPQDREMASTVLRRAEDYYNRIGAQIGYTRYHNFWTWDERVKIIIFPDKQSFVQTTGQPLWSNGYAARDSHVFKSRTIVTYKQEQDFYDGLLPHEISHLVLEDFVQGQARVPVFFDEGVAQLQEKSKSQVADRVMRVLVRKGQYIPFSSFVQLDIRKEPDTQKVQIFYAQSLSVVEFLIRSYGTEAFGRLCRNIKDGKSFEEAVRATYTNSIRSLADLEGKWVRAMSQ